MKTFEVLGLGNVDYVNVMDLSSSNEEQLEDNLAEKNDSTYMILDPIGKGI